MGFEIAEAVPVHGCGEIDLGDGDVAPVVGLRDDVAVVVEDAGDHPIVLRGVGVGAAGDEDVVFAGAGTGEHGIAAPNRPGDDLRAADGERAGDLGKKPS